MAYIIIASQILHQVLLSLFPSFNFLHPLSPHPPASFLLSVSPPLSIIYIYLHPSPTRLFLPLSFFLSFFLSTPPPKAPPPPPSHPLIRVLLPSPWLSCPYVSSFSLFGLCSKINSQGDIRSLSVW